MKYKLVVVVIAIVILVGTYPQNVSADEEKTVVVLGSSMARGWVTSYSARYDMENGWAPRLKRSLENTDFNVINIAEPGFNTEDALKLYDEAIPRLKPDILILALSMGNEGLNRRDPQLVYQSFRDGINKLVSKSKEDGIKTILASCYSCDLYGEKQYDLIRQMNLYQNSLGLPVINLLGALNDGNGHFPKGYTYDDSHPDNIGHEEMFYAVVPSLFLAIEENKPLPNKTMLVSDLTRLNKQQHLVYIPEYIVHSFTVVMDVKPEATASILTIGSAGKNVVLSVTSQGEVSYQDSNGKLAKSNISAESGEVFTIAVTHGYLNRETDIYANGDLLFSVNEQLEPEQFDFSGEAEIGNILIYRSALNSEEVEYLNKGNLVLGSMEVFAPLDTQELVNNAPVENLAQSKSELLFNPVSTEAELADLQQQIILAKRDREEQNQYKDPEIIELDDNQLQKYVGKYFASNDDFIELTLENNQLILNDRGRQAFLLPISENKFIFKIPVENSVEFSNQAGMYAVIFKVGGFKFEGRKR